MQSNNRIKLYLFTFLHLFSIFLKPVAETRVGDIRIETSKKLNMQLTNFSSLKIHMLRVKLHVVTCKLPVNTTMNFALSST